MLAGRAVGCAGVWLGASMARWLCLAMGRLGMVSHFRPRSRSWATEVTLSNGVKWLER